MNNNPATLQFMDKQIMDLSNTNNTDFIDFLKSEKKDDIIPSYDFMPIRPIVGSSSPPPPRSSNFDLGGGGGDDDAPLRSWSSLDSRPSASTVRNYDSLDAGEPVKFNLGKSHRAADSSLDVSSEIDRTMKKYMDNLMHAIEGVSARLSQLETRTRNLENLVDDLKISVEDNHGNTHREMRQLENILGEVNTSVRSIRDKQDVFEAQLQVSKLHIPKVEQTESQKTTYADTQPGASAPQQFSANSLAQPPPSALPPNATLPPPQQQNFQQQVQLPNQFPQNQVPSVPQRESYFSPTGHTLENQGQQYQLPPQQQPQPQLPSPPPPPHPSQQVPPNQYFSPPQPHYPQPPPPPQPHPSFSAVNPSLPQVPLGHHPEETPYAPSQTYTAPSQQLHVPPSNAYEPQTNTFSPRYSSSFGSSLGRDEPYSYSSSQSQYGSGSPMKGQNLSSFMGQSSGGGYPQLPTARILPQAIPTASGVGSGSGSGGSGNKVPIDDVVDKVTSMGFSRDQVRATVRRLTENGQAVDLNIVLDKLMNDGGGQAPGAWFGS